MRDVSVYLAFDDPDNPLKDNCSVNTWSFATYGYENAEYEIVDTSNLGNGLFKKALFISPGKRTFLKFDNYTNVRLTNYIISFWIYELGYTSPYTLKPFISCGVNFRNYGLNREIGYWHIYYGPYTSNNIPMPFYQWNHLSYMIDNSITKAYIHVNGKLFQIYTDNNRKIDGCPTYITYNPPAGSSLNYREGWNGCYLKNFIVSGDITGYNNDIIRLKETFEEGQIYNTSLLNTLDIGSSYGPILLNSINFNVGTLDRYIEQDLLNIHFTICNNSGTDNNLIYDNSHIDYPIDYPIQDNWKYNNYKLFEINTNKTEG